MNDDPTPDPRLPRIFLCLSGGGFRASLFHLGCLKRLHEVGLLPHVYALSATSGGAITAALLSLFQRGLDPQTRRLRFDWDGFESALLGLVRDGILGFVIHLLLAYGAYAAGALVLLSTGQRTLGISLLALGAGLHGALFLRLLRRGAHRHSSHETAAAAINGQHLTPVTRRSLGRLARMVTSPPRLRLETLNLLHFGWRRLDELLLPPSIYLTAVDLNDGREKVFTQGSLSALDAHGASELWENRARREAADLPVDLAQAVAASTAIPPLFWPVHLYTGPTLRGAFVDGGVADNLAINVPKAFAAQINPDLHVGRYGSEAPMSSFKERTWLMLVLDGSKPMLTERRWWPGGLSFLRVLDAMSNQHVADAEFTVLNFQLTLGIPARLIALQQGVPGIDEVDPRFGDALRRVRTHLDAFSLQECAALSYAGYALTDRAIGELGRPLGDYAGASWVPARSLPEILPASCGAWSVERECLCRHLRYSNRRLSVLRWLGRSCGL